MEETEKLASALLKSVNTARVSYEAMLVLFPAINAEK
jgi:hypothetical protein